MHLSYTENSILAHHHPSSVSIACHSNHALALSYMSAKMFAQSPTPLAKDRTFVFSTTEKSLPNVKFRYLKPSNALLYMLLYKKPKKKGSVVYTHTNALKCESVTPNPITSILSSTKAKLLPVTQKAAMYALRSSE